MSIELHPSGSAHDCGGGEGTGWQVQGDAEPDEAADLRDGHAAPEDRLTQELEQGGW